eukprot:m.258457 g.258457  ORF g.258457 m.258457 type:complete len:100 (-) comp26619_c0_seq2:28-327(-)
MPVSGSVGTPGIGGDLPAVVAFAGLVLVVAMVAITRRTPMAWFKSFFLRFFFIPVGARRYAVSCVDPLRSRDHDGRGPAHIANWTSPHYTLSPYRSCAN